MSAHTAPAHRAPDAPDAPRESLPVAIRTLGCKVNRAESEMLAAALLGRGVELAEEDMAAVVVVNTCTVTGEADAKARKAVRRALGAARRPVVVVTGCLAALDRAGLESLGERVVVEVDKDALARRVWTLAGAGEDDVPARATSRAGEAFRTRATLKIEDGCDNFCAYCIVPHARGGPRATPLDELVARAASLAEAGVRELVLTGINLGRYRDGATGADLPTLVGALAATGVERIRLSSIEPPDLTARLLGVLAETPSACAHVHVPLQSGSDAVLARMRRRYTAEEYAARVEAAREALPGLALTTDVLVGFPGETDADAAVTREYCERIGFAKLHVFRYSRRGGTPAAEMPGQVPAPVSASRAQALRDLGEELAARDARDRLGDRAEALIERITRARGGSPTRADGTTREYVKVRFEADGFAVGDLVAVELGERAGARVCARVVSPAPKGARSAPSVVESHGERAAGDTAASA